MLPARGRAALPLPSGTLRAASLDGELGLRAPDAVKELRGVVGYCRLLWLCCVTLVIFDIFKLQLE